MPWRNPRRFDLRHIGGVALFVAAVVVLLAGIAFFVIIAGMGR